MSHIITRKIISARHEAFGREWWYDFRLLPAKAEADKARDFIASHFEQFGALTKKWDDEKNSEWAVRCYLSARLIMASTIYLNSV